MIDWTQFTDDPLDQSIRLKIARYIKSISAVVDVSLLQYFSASASGRDVLHIGCCEHSEKYMSLEGWKHREMAEVARTIIGLDINEPGVAAMRTLGYEVICADATGDSDMGQRFDRVIIGDVIEHVRDQQALLQFASRHLKPDGRVIVSTPNPFFIGHVVQAWFGRPMIANFEHVSWVTESNILELARRSALNLTAVHYSVGKSAKSRIASALKRASYGLVGTALFTSNIYVLTPRATV